MGSRDDYSLGPPAATEGREEAGPEPQRLTRKPMLERRIMLRLPSNKIDARVRATKAPSEVVTTTLRFV
jgi:hypothetical protein